MRVLGASLLVVVCAACGNGDKGGDSGDDGPGTTTVPGDFSADIVLDECRKAAIRVTWSGDAGVGHVEYGMGGLDEATLDLTTPDDGGGTDHAFTLRGLTNGETYTVKPVLVTDRGERIEGDTVQLDLPFAPAELMPMTIDESAVDPARSEVYNGFITVSTLGAESSYGTVMDPKSGQYTWWVTVDDPANQAVGRIKPSRDGQSLLWNDYDRSRAVDVAHTYTSSHDGCDEVTTRNLWGHHDFIELADGGHGWLSYTFDEALPVDGYGDLPIMADNIYEAAAGSDTETPTEIWNALEDWDCPVYWTGPTMELDAWVPGYHEWSHGNSLAYLDEDDAYFVLMRYTDALVKVSRATGETVWTMGGPCGTVTRSDGGDAPFWSFPHFSQVWRADDGIHVLIFDNGDNYDPQISRVVEWVIDEAKGSATQAWEYPNPSGEFVRILGDARRLQGGNTLISWSPQGVLEEVTPEGDRVWYATSGLGQTVGRVHFVPDLYAGTIGGLGSP